MKLQLERDERVSSGLRRLAICEIDDALGVLARPAGVDDMVHCVRQSLKRLHALLELARDAIGTEAYDSERCRIRAAGRLLGEARDAAVRVETLEGLAQHFAGQLSRAAHARVRRELAVSRDEHIARLVDEEHILERASEILVSASESISAWPRDSNSFGCVRRGIRRAYRTGLKRRQTADRDQSSHNFHEWRRPVKELFHQLQVVSPMWPRPIEALAKEFHDLAGLLNEDHDLAMLREHLLAPGTAVKPRDVEALAALIDERCAVLRVEALALGELLYDETPREFAGRLAHVWRLWKSRKHTSVPALV